MYQRKMHFHSGRAEQLASFLRDQILSGELANPLPSSRVWCRQLNVGRPNLLRALQILEHAGLVRITARGTMLTSRGKKKGNPSPATPHRVARILFYGGSYTEPQSYSKWIFMLSDALQNQDIRFSLERCCAKRLRTIATQERRADELHFLLSLPVAYQQLFVESKNPAVILGYAGEGISIPFLTSDLANSARHAAMRLLRKGFKRLVLINVSNKEVGVAKSIESFKLACNQWPHQPIRAEIVRVWTDTVSLRLAMEKLARKNDESCGYIVFAPVPIAMLATTLLKQGISIPDQAEIVAIEHTTDEARLSVPVTLYGFPSSRFAKMVLEISHHYFETGKVIQTGRVLDHAAPKVC
jgi:DNA-binding LacI/PurR family transcriptional regulator